MHFRILLSLLVVISAFALPSVAYAGIPFFGPIIPAEQAACPAGWGLVIVVINNLISFLITITIVFVAPVMIAYAGFLMVMNPVNSGGISKAKSVLTNTVIGIVVALASWMIIDAVMAVLYNPDASSGQTKLGVWSSLITTGGADTCLKIAGALSQATPKPPVTTAPPIITVPGDTTEAGVRARLAAAGVRVNNAPCPAGSNGRGCTNVGGMQENTIRQVIAIARAVDCNELRCDVIVTGGTEPGHAAGTYSHANGYKVDFGLNSAALNKYFETFTLSGQRGGDSGGPIRKDSCGNEYVKETTHWDVTVRAVCGGSGVGPAACESVGTVDKAGGDSLASLKFNLRRGQIGSFGFTYPDHFNSSRVTLSTVGATGSETPAGMQVEIAVSKCKGSFDVPQGCTYTGTAYATQLAIGEGTSCPLTSGTWYYNIRYPDCQPTGTNGVDYCATWTSYSG